MHNRRNLFDDAFVRFIDQNCKGEISTQYDLRTITVDKISPVGQFPHILKTRRVSASIPGCNYENDVDGDADAGHQWLSRTDTRTTDRLVLFRFVKCGIIPLDNQLRLYWGKGMLSGDFS